MVISNNYRQLLRELHDRELSFAGGTRTNLVAQVIELLGVESISDYGCGKMVLNQKLTQEFQINIEYFPYDPAFPEYGPPKTADLICCIEVLEHVEPEHIHNVLNELANLVSKYGFFTVHCSNSSKTLADGRNAHILQKPISWWLTELSKHFEIQWLNKTGSESFAVLVTPLGLTSLDISRLEITQNDSFKTFVSRFLYLAQRELRRRVQRRYWRPR
jgi:hypothetical protein